MKFDHVYKDINIASMVSDNIDIIENGIIATLDDIIVYVGEEAGFDIHASNISPIISSMDGRLATPGLIDCHTHLVFGGHRADEFQARLSGIDYRSISLGGGGILSSVEKTRNASHEDLYKYSDKHLQYFLREGVTTIEIKSGYGLDAENEGKQLRVARELGINNQVDVKTTCLAAHTLPSEYKGQTEKYIALVTDEIIPRLHEEGLIDYIDVFLETIAFSENDVQEVFDIAEKLEIKVRIHADQLSDSGGAQVAAKHKALSADHLEYTPEKGILALAKSGTTAVLLPGAFYTLREKKKPSVELFRKHGVPMAIATDFNPGSSPLRSPLLAMNQACSLFDLTVSESLLGMTRNAARALGLTDRGTLEAGKRADIAFWEIESIAELVYWIGGALPCIVVYGGKRR